MKNKITYAFARREKHKNNKSNGCFRSFLRQQARQSYKNANVYVYVTQKHDFTFTGKDERERGGEREREREKLAEDGKQERGENKNDRKTEKRELVFA